MKQACSIRINGRVQGVGFRFHTLRMANELHISGFVRNMTDGSVYIEAEGERPDLDSFIDWCHEGPRWAEVEKIDVTTVEARHYIGFSVH